MKRLGKFIGGLATGIVTGLLAAVAIFLALGGGTDVGGVSALAMLTGFTIVLWLAYTAKSIKSAWGRGFLVCAVLSFALPLSGFVYSEIEGSRILAEDPTLGAAIGVRLGRQQILQETASVGFFLGLIFLIMAFLLLKRDTKEGLDEAVQILRNETPGRLKSDMPATPIPAPEAKLGLTTPWTASAHGEGSPLEASVPPGANKQCPYCAEWIKAEARVCRYCGRDLPIEPETAEPMKAESIKVEPHEPAPPGVPDEEVQAHLAGQTASSAQAAELKLRNAHGLRSMLTILAGVGIAMLFGYLIVGLSGTSRKSASVSDTPAPAEQASVSKAPVQTAGPSAVIAEPTVQIEPEDNYWVTVDRLNRSTCPSASCGIIGQLFFREGTTVHERRGGWARISDYYAASCVNGRNEYVESGNNLCTPENGIVGGRFAEWVPAEFLSRERPPDPAARTTGIDALVAQSDDYRLYRPAFVKAAQSLISSGRCSETDFTEFGGWVKSSHRDQPIYFIYCGGSTLANRLYLNVETGEIFR